MNEQVDSEKGVPYGFFLTSNVHKIPFLTGASPRTPLGEFTTLIYAYKSAGLM